jgi:hypothetical protein
VKEVRRIVLVVTYLFAAGRWRTIVTIIRLMASRNWSFSAWMTDRLQSRAPLCIYIRIISPCLWIGMARIGSNYDRRPRLGALGCQGCGWYFFFGPFGFLSYPALLHNTVQKRLNQSFPVNHHHLWKRTMPVSTEPPMGDDANLKGTAKNQRNEFGHRPKILATVRRSHRQFQIPHPVTPYISSSSTLQDLAT